MSELTGTMECPICGQSSPHAHHARQIAFWVDAQASRFGFRALVYPVPKPVNDIKSWTLDAMRKEKTSYEAAYGLCPDWLDDAIQLIEALEPRVSLTNCEKP